MLVDKPGSGRGNNLVRKGLQGCSERLFLESNYQLRVVDGVQSGIGYANNTPSAAPSICQVSTIDNTSENKKLGMLTDDAPIK